MNFLAKTRIKPPLRYLLTVAVLSASLVSAVIFLQANQAPAEPSYEGKLLSEWIDELIARDKEYLGLIDSEQAKAIRKIGSNALPWLLHEIRAGYGPWKLDHKVNRLLEKQSFTGFRFSDAMTRKKRAICGFRSLGPLAASAIPDLLSLAEVQTDWVTSALAGIGTPAIPALRKCVTNTLVFNTARGPIVPLPRSTLAAVGNGYRYRRLTLDEVRSFLPEAHAWLKSPLRPTNVFFSTADAFVNDFGQPIP